MYIKELKKLDTDDLMSIRDQLRILREVVFNLQSLDANLKIKKLGFGKKSRAEMRAMYTFAKFSLSNLEKVLDRRAK